MLRGKLRNFRSRRNVPGRIESRRLTPTQTREEDDEVRRSLGGREGKGASLARTRKGRNSTRSDPDAGKIWEWEMKMEMEIDEQRTTYNGWRDCNSRRRRNRKQVWLGLGQEQKQKPTF